MTPVTHRRVSRRGPMIDGEESGFRERRELFSRADDGAVKFDAATTDIVIADNDECAFTDEYHPRSNDDRLSAHGALSSTEDGGPMIFSGRFARHRPGYPEDPNTSGTWKNRIALN